MIRRRVRWLLRVGLVLVLALSLSVVGAIRSNQEAKAFAPLLAPLAPVMVATGPAGILIGGGLILASVLAADQLSKPDANGDYWWQGAGDRWKDLLGGTKDKWDNRDAGKDPEQSKEDTKPSGGEVLQARPITLEQWKESAASNGTRQVRASVEWSALNYVPPYQQTLNAWGMTDMNCRADDGSVKRQLKALNMGATVVSQTVNTWRPSLTSFACDSGGSIATLKPISMTVNPMTRDNWTSVGSGYPRTGGPYTYDYTMQRGYTWVFDGAYKGTDGTKTTVTCESPDGTVEVIAGSARDAEGIKIPTCPDGWKVKGLKMERTNPDGSVAAGLPPVQVDRTGDRPVAVAVDGVECVQGREGCADWTQVKATQPERVQCLSGGQVIAGEHCNVLERFYENGGTVVHPDNVDGNPATYYDPWQDSTFKPVVKQPDGTYAPAPYRPTERPPVIAPQPWTPDPNWDPDNDPDDPRNDPTATPQPTAPPTVPPDLDPDYDPVKDPNHPDYNPKFDPNHPDYDPVRDPSHPDYDPYKDPDSPLYDPTPDPEPTTPVEPEPEPTQDPQPEPTTEPEPEPTSEPEPSQEPTQEPGDGEEDPEPSPEPTEVVDPDLEPGLEPGEPPYEPPPTAVGVDEWGHLLPITASVGTLSVTPSGARVYTQPDTKVATTYFPDGTKETTFTAPEVETPTGTAPLDLKTVTAPDGTKTTTGYPSVEVIETPGTLGETPTRGVHAPPEVIEGTCESQICLSIPEPPDALKTKNCIRGAYSWNPVDWVKTPVLCALREAFEPSPDKLDANVQRIKIALSARGFDILIKSFEDVVTATPGGGGGCRGPEISWSVSGQDFLMYPFDACSGAMANVAHYTHIFVTFAVGIFGMIGVIRNIAYGFGHRVQVGEGTESSS